MDAPDVEVHFYLEGEAGGQLHTRSFISLVVPVKLRTTPLLAPADRPPSAPNPAFCRIVLKSSCAAGECRKMVLAEYFIASRSERLQIECLTEMPSCV
jgi:hypothetical protein